MLKGDSNPDCLTEVQAFNFWSYKKKDEVGDEFEAFDGISCL